MSRQFADLFLEAAARAPQATALHYHDKAANTWREMTWQQYREKVTALAGWLRTHGIVPGDRVAILSLNRPEWLITDLAILMTGAISVPVYATSSHKDIRYILDHSGAKALFVDEMSRIAFLSAQEVPGSVVCFDPPTSGGGAGLPHKTLAEVLVAGAPELGRPVETKADDIATIIYTSGTTGNPKGVIHTHGGIMATVRTVADILSEGQRGPDRFFSFLPLSHVAERVLVEFGSIISASEVAFARSVDTLVEDLNRFRPTILLCVPRLWERIYERITKGLSEASPVKRGVFALARRLGSCRIAGDRIIKARDGMLSAKVGDALVGRAMRAKLGMDRVRLFLTGSAPTRAEILRFFGAFGIFIREVYGLTENLCLGTDTGSAMIVLGSCGQPFRGGEMRLAADGEICFRAPWIFKGYYRNEEASREVLSPDGWFATGDLGRVDNEGRLHITGRKKELLKTSTGKYVAPVPIEDVLKLNPVISDAMVVGDNEKYCVALVVLDKAMLPPQPAGSVDMNRIIKEHLDKINANLAHHESIKRVGVLKTAFSIEGGTLTPSLKLKRKAALAAHSDFIRRVYEATDVVVYES